MKSNVKHSTLFIGFILKGTLLAFFTCFFIGQNMVSNFLSIDENDYELFEELETSDAEEDAEEKSETDHKFNEYAFFESLNNSTILIPIETWNNTLCYEGFKREIPDPPPEA